MFKISNEVTERGAEMYVDDRLKCCKISKGTQNWRQN